jgi:hypothetical protein
MPAGPRQKGGRRYIWPAQNGYGDEALPKNENYGGGGGVGGENCLTSENGS